MPTTQITWFSLSLSLSLSLRSYQPFDLVSLLDRIQCLHRADVLWTSTELQKEKSKGRRYPTEIIIDTDNTYDLALIAITLAQAESMLYYLEHAARGIGLYGNSDKTEFMCFNENGTISSLNDKLLKLEGQFTYLRSNISSTESNVNIRICKAWTVLDRLSTK